MAFRCADIDECQNATICAYPQRCLNLLGSYACTGYIAPGCVGSLARRSIRLGLLHFLCLCSSLSVVSGARVVSGTGVVLNSNYGGAKLRFTEQLSSFSSVVLSSVYYEGGYPLLRFDNVPRAITALSPTQKAITATIGAGVGPGWTFGLRFCATGFNATVACVDALSDDASFDYPLLNITAHSLRRFADNSTLAGATLKLPNSFPELVTFTGSGFLNDSSLVSVVFGPPEQPDKFACDLDTAHTTSTRIVCR